MWVPAFNWRLGLVQVDLTKSWRQLVIDERSNDEIFASEMLVIRILDPTRAQHFIAEIVHALQDGDIRHRSRRRRGLTGTSV